MLSSGYKQALVTLEGSIPSLGRTAIDEMQSALLSMSKKLDVAKERSFDLPEGGFWPWLPNELYMIIFEFFYEDAEGYQTDPLCSPAILCLVARRWNENAKATPRLWAKVAIYGHNWTACHRSIRRAEVWLPRTRRVAVRIHVDFPRGTGTVALRGHRLGMTLVENHMGHCDHITIIVQGCQILSNAVDRLQRRAPMLRHCNLVLSCRSDDPVIALPYVKTLFSMEAPQLIRIMLPSLVMNWPLDMFTNLRTISFVDRTHITIRQALAPFAFGLSLPRLENVSLSKFTLTSADDSSYSVFNSSIINVSLNGKSYGDAFVIFDRLVLPSLRSATIDGFSSSPVEHFHGVCSSPFLEMHTLNIHADINSRRGVHEFTARLPNLTTLLVCNIEVLELLSVRKIDQASGLPGTGADVVGPVVRCPRLTSLEFRLDISDVVFDGPSVELELMKFLTDRADNGCARLEKLIMPDLGDERPQLEQALLTFDANLNIEVSFGPYFIHLIG